MSRPITIADALFVLRPGAQWNLLDSTDYNTLNWLDTVQSKPSEQEVQDEITTLTLQQPYNECKEKAQKLLDESDWATKSDVTDTSLNPHLVNSADFVAYRLALRTLRINPQVNPVWPVYPTEIWSS